MAYASKYYDPVKAHEYYMKHRQLKGQNSRSSTAGLNEQAKAIAKQVKETINEQKKAYLNDYKEKLKSKIKDIRARMKGMSPEDKERLKSEIEGLKNAYKIVKDNAKKMFDEEYMKELDKLKADKTMLQAKKGKKKKKK